MAKKPLHERLGVEPEEVFGVTFNDLYYKIDEYDTLQYLSSACSRWVKISPKILKGKLSKDTIKHLM